MYTTQNKIKRVSKARFTVDDEAHFDGYHCGEEWNGFACPYFEFNEAIKVMDKMYSINGEPTWTFDVDSFGALYDPDDAESLDVWLSEIVKCGDEYKLVFGIGGKCWAWSKEQ